MEKIFISDDDVNHNYPDDFELKIYTTDNTVINEDFSVTTMVPTKVYLPTVYEKNYLTR